MSVCGKLITVEGIEGVGKSTLLPFMADFLKKKGKSLLICREPGGTEMSEKIRKILLMPSVEEPMMIYTELLLMFAARAQLVLTRIMPALERGEWVLCDRFVDASFAYQGGGRGIPEAHIAALEQWVLQGLTPDLTILLDAPVKLGLARATKKGPKDRIEQETVDFFERVRQVYLTRASKDKKRYHVIDSTQSLKKIKEAMSDLLSQVV